MRQNRLVGTWRLISAEYRAVDGQVIYPYGRDPIGYILYSDDGYISVAIMTEGRANFASGDRMGGTTEEKARAVDTYLSYCGRYEIRENKVIHHIEVSLYPNSVGTDQERMFDIDEDQLTLYTQPFLLGGALRTGHLVWKRAPGRGYRDVKSP